MTKQSSQHKTPPDGRGKRPTDPNQLAKWIVEQSVSSCEQSPNQTEESDDQNDTS